jgi:hypothetical protein
LQNIRTQIGNLHIIDPFMTKNKNPFWRKFTILSVRAVLYLQFCCFFAQKQPFLTKYTIFFCQSMGNQNGNFKHFYMILLWHNRKSILKINSQL